MVHDDWRLLASELGVTSADVDNILQQYNYPSEQVWSVLLLRLWPVTSSQGEEAGKGAIFPAVNFWAIVKLSENLFLSKTFRPFGAPKPPFWEIKKQNWNFVRIKIPLTNICIVCRKSAFPAPLRLLFNSWRHWLRLWQRLRFIPADVASVASTTTATTKSTTTTIITACLYVPAVSGDATTMAQST